MSHATASDAAPTIARESGAIQRKRFSPLRPRRLYPRRRRRGQHRSALWRPRAFRVRLLVNATRYDMLAALNDMRERLTEKDNLLIYYAGHGELDERNQRGHWLPIDAEPNSTANWISNVAVTDVLNSMTVQQLLVVADSCYAGTLTRSSLGRLEGGLSESERLRLLSAMAHQRSRMVLTWESHANRMVVNVDGGRPDAWKKPPYYADIKKWALQAVRNRGQLLVWQGKDVLKVPSSALFRREGDWSVFVLENGRARRRAVQIGQRNAREAEVVGGLGEGSVVILHPTDQVDEGVRVKPVPTERTSRFDERNEIHCSVLLMAE